MIDRFGLLPDPARNLLDVAIIRLKARAVGLRKIEASDKGGYFDFAPKNNVDPAWLIGLLQKEPQQWKLDGPTRLRFTRELSERKVRLEWVQGFVSQLAQRQA